MAARWRRSLPAARQKYLEGFGPKAPGFDQVPFGDIEAVEGRDHGRDRRASCIEPVQGEGGIRPATNEFMRRLRALCDEHGLLLILDEVQMRRRPHGQALRPRMVRHHARHHGRRQGHRRRLPARRLPCHGGGGLRHGGRHPWLDLWRQSAGHGGRQCRARCHARRWLPRACARRGAASSARDLPRSRIAIRDVIEDIRGEGLMLGIKASVPSAELLQAIRAAQSAWRAGGRQRHPPAAAAGRHGRGGPRRPCPRRSAPPKAFDALKPSRRLEATDASTMTDRSRHMASTKHFLDLSAVSAADLRAIIDDAKSRKPASRPARATSRSPARCWR